MRTLLITGLLLAAIVGNSQIIAGLEGGLTLNKTLAFGAHGGYKLNKVNAIAGVQTHFSNKVKNGASLQARIGYELKVTKDITFMPSAGYSYNLKTIDVKGLNKSQVITGLQVNKYFEHEDSEGRVGLSFTYTGNWHFITVIVDGLF